MPGRCALGRASKTQNPAYDTQPCRHSQPRVIGCVYPAHAAIDTDKAVWAAVTQCTRVVARTIAATCEPAARSWIMPPPSSLSSSCHCRRMAGLSAHLRHCCVSLSASSAVAQVGAASAVATPRQQHGSRRRYDIQARASEIDPAAREHPEINFVFTDNAETGQVSCAGPAVM